MSFGFDDTKEQVRQAIDIVDLVGGYLDLRRQGRMHVAQCPWHDDTRPSLQVNPDRQTWKCWVCDIGGDIFSFTMKREGLNFREALELLAERAGIELGPRRNIKPGSVNDKRTLYHALAWAEELFHKSLMSSEAGDVCRRYALDRGLSEEVWRRFNLGYAVSDGHWLIEQGRRASISPEILEAVGLIARNTDTGRFYDRFRGRLMFPIRDLQSRPIAFGGRILPSFETDQRGRTAAKYYNSPETSLFSKSDQLYALNLARDETKAENGRREIVVVEGYTDVIALHEAGLRNAVAVLGTALTDRHVKLLGRFADTIYLVLDGDEAGRRRSNEVLELFIAKDADLRVLTLPNELDPCDFVEQRGADEFRRLLAEADDALEHAVHTNTAGIDLTRQTHLANQALERILHTLAKAPRVQTDSSKRLRQQQMLSRLARQFRVSEEELRLRLEEIRRSADQKKSRTTTTEPAPSKRFRIRDLSPIERELLEVLISDLSLCAAAREHIGVGQLDSATGRQLFNSFADLSESGQPPEFAHLMTMIDDVDLKNIVVELDETAGKKIVHTEVDTATRLNDLVKQISQRQIDHLKQEKVQSLQAGNVGADDEVDVLEQLFKLERDRQGISEPTDG